MPGQYKLGDEPVPGYRLVEFLGRGGFGEVWKATAPGGTETALKIISLSGKQGLKEFQALGLVKRIRHPNLVPIVAFWLKDQGGNLLDDAETDIDALRKLVSTSATLKGTMMLDPKMQARPVELLIAMGLGEQDLYARLEQCRNEGLPGIPQEELLGYMEDAARAIDYLNSPRHNLGTGMAAVQHCDIKPFNIMIVGGAAQVCDFGLARMLGDVRKTATAAGTIAYVAPECLSKNEPSSATDQYSLAVTYVELKTGKLPYDSEIYTDVVNAIVGGKLDLSMLPPAERAVIGRATSIDPSDRYPSAVAMIGDLKRAVEGGPLAAAPLRPRRRAPLVVALLLLAIAGGAYAGWLFWPPAGTIDPADEDAQLLVEGDPQLEGDPEEEIDPPIDTDGTEGEDPSDPPIDTNDDGHSGTAATDTDDPPDDSPPAELISAQRMADGERWQSALEELDAVDIAALPAAIQFDALLLKGTCYLEVKVYAAAIAELTQAIEIDPSIASSRSRASAFSRRALAYRESRRASEAIEDYGRALELDPNALDLIGRGTAYEIEEEWASAIEDYTKALATNPDDRAKTDALLARARSYAESDQLDKAIADYTAALRLGVDYPYEVHEVRGIAARLLGRKDLADLDKQLHEDLVDIERQDSYEALTRVAQILAAAPVEEVRDGPRAIEHATRAREIRKDANALAILAAAHAEAGDFDEAAKIQAEAMELAGGALKAEHQRRLQLYQSRSPLRLDLAELLSAP